jgi:hypothetical protein
MVQSAAAPAGGVEVVVVMKRSLQRIGENAFQNDR